jgi:hypothetical protein
MGKYDRDSHNHCMCLGLHDITRIERIFENLREVFCDN